MTCPSLLGRPPATAELLAELSRRRASGPSRAARVLRRLQGDDAAAQFSRFVLVGALSSVLYAVLFLALAPWGAQTANIAGALASSALANELHRQLTFHAGGRVAWFTAQWEGGGIALAGILATTAALGAFAAYTDDAGSVAQLLLVGLVTGAIGLVRFVALRWVFAPRRARRA